MLEAHLHVRRKYLTLTSWLQHRVWEIVFRKLGRKTLRPFVPFSPGDRVTASISGLTPLTVEFEE